MSRGGTLAIIRAAGTTLNLAMIDGPGPQDILFRNGGFWAPRFSRTEPIAFGDRNPDDLWIYDVDTRSRRAMDAGRAEQQRSRLESGRQPARVLGGSPYTEGCAGSQRRRDRCERQLVVREGLQWPSDWTRTGYLVFTDVPLDEDRDIWAVKADGSEAPFPYLDTPFIEKSGEVSPDGHWIAYDSNAPGRFEVFVNSFPKPSAQPVIVSTEGGRNPRWGPEGGLYYWNEGRLIEARLALGERPRVLGSSTVLQDPMPAPTTRTTMCTRTENDSWW